MHIIRKRSGLRVGGVLHKDIEHNPSDVRQTFGKQINAHADQEHAEQFVRAHLPARLALTSNVVNDSVSQLRGFGPQVPGH